MKTTTNLKVFIRTFHLFILLCTIVYAQDYNKQSNQEKSNGTQLEKYSQVSIMETGVLLYSFNLLTDRSPLGVTIVNGTVIVSSQGTGQNYFDLYSLDGTYQTSFDQGTTSTYGFRDLAYDGTYILASDDNNIRKINPTTFEVVSSITNDTNSPHRGLAYDSNEDVIYSTNFRNGPLVKINAQTGETIKTYSTPSRAPYGIALDVYTNSSFASLWYAEPSNYGTFRISRADTSTGTINFAFDLTDQTSNPDSALVGGLEIINNHPNYPNNVIAVAVEQHSKKILFVDITDAPRPLPVALDKVGEFGGFDANGIITSGMEIYSDRLYCVNNNEVSIYDITTDPTNPTFVKQLGFTEVNKIFFNNNKMYLTTSDPDFNILSIYDLTNPLNPQLLSSYDAGLPILKLIFYNNYIFIAKSNSNTLDILDVTNKSQPNLAGTYVLPAPVTEIIVDTSRSILFAGYYVNSGSEGVDLLDISDISNIVLLNQIVSLDEITQTMAIKNNILFLAQNWSSIDRSGLRAYDYSNSAAPEYLNSVNLASSSNSWQIKFVGDFIAASLPGSGLHTYSWDEQLKSFFTGPTIQLDEPRDFVIYNQQTSALKQNSIMDNSSITQYLYVINGYGEGSTIAGSYKTKIVKIVTPPPALVTYTLSKGVSPQAAKDAGCYATANPGQSEYTSGTSVTLQGVSVTPWIFKEWTGDLSGNANPQNLIMNSNKTVTAVFEIPTTATLTMNISPPEAAQNGCSTSPSGTNIYPLDETVPLNANDNPTGGWHFKEWTGDASGNSATTNVTMNDDKNVTANFVYVELAVSGSEVMTTICPDSGKTDLMYMLPINLTASQADSWNVTEIKLIASGTGDDSLDIKNVVIMNGANQIFSGTFPSDDGSLEASFDPIVVVPAGETIQLKLFYDLDYDEDTYAHNSTKTFSVETGKITATPQTYSEGSITGKAKNDKLSIARVFNNNGYGFANIDIAIFSDRTAEGDTCFVCKGTYVENITVNKSVTIQPIIRKYGEEILVYSLNSTSPVIEIKSDSVTIKGLTIFSPYTGQTGIYVGSYGKDLRQIKLIDNKIHSSLFSDGIEMSRIKNGTIQNNNISVSKYPISLIKTDSIQISDNLLIITDDVFLSHLTLEKSSNNRIFSNYSQGNNKMSISLDSSNNNKIYDNSALIAGMFPGKITLDNSSGNKIFDNTNLTIRLDEQSNYNLIDDNITPSITIDNSLFNMINENTIENSDNTGINSDNTGIKINNTELNLAMAVTPFNKIINNRISGHEDGGIFIKNSSINITVADNKIINNGKGYIPHSGIRVIKSSNIKIKNNRIKNNGLHGVDLKFVSSVKLINNRIENHSSSFLGIKGVGVNVSFSRFVDIIDNVLLRNCTGVKVEKSNNTKISLNYVMDSFCLFTGIHINNSSPDIFGNNIANNNGNGIMIENGANPIISSNNIFGNSESGLNNIDPNVTINGENNWWGSAEGPGSSDIAGNVNVTNWLSQPASLLAVVEVDTFYSSPGSVDSVSAFFQNLQNPDDVLNITITDEKGWIKEPTSFIGTTEDSSGIAVNINFEIPSNTSENSVNKILINAVSQSDSSISISDSILVFVYAPELLHLVISPDSVTIARSDSIKFYASGMDQFNNTLNIEPLWSASAGTIDSTGLFKPDSVIGEITINAMDPISGNESTAIIFAANEFPTLASIQIEPDSITLNPYESNNFNAIGKNEYGFPQSFSPVWSAEGGIIDDYGFFIADSIPGSFTVTVSDTSGLISATATVIIPTIISVDEDKFLIPKEYFLSQNYPNPFNPSTTISYGLPFESKVKVVIFNILGQRVDIITNGIESAGIHSTLWDASHLASGIYFIRINATSLTGSANITKSIKMLLLK